MAEIALGLDGLNRNQKKTLARSLKTGLTGNAKFPSPDPSPADLEAAAVKVELHESKTGDAEGKLAMERVDLHNAEGELDDVLSAAARDAMDTTTEEADLLSANFPLKAARTAVGILDAPENLHMSDGDLNNSSDWQWNARRKATGYVGEIAEDENGPWRQVYIGTKSRCTVPDLDPTKLYYGRVCTQATAGMGRWGAAIAFRVR